MSFGSRIRAQNSAVVRGALIGGAEIRTGFRVEIDQIPFTGQ